MARNNGRSRGIIVRSFRKKQEATQPPVSILKYKLNYLKIMKVRIEYIEMEVDKLMNERVYQKLNKLQKKFNQIVMAEVTFKHEKDLSGKGKSCSVEIRVPGVRLFARTYSYNFESSLNESVRDLKRKLRKRKTAFQRRRLAPVFIS